MRFLVISDTHRFLRDSTALINKYKEKVDAVIHLGDLINDVKALKIKFPDMTFYYVSGNNDYDANVPYEKTLDINGRKILLTHGHRQMVGLGLMHIKHWAQDNSADAVLFGHTHMPICQREDELVIFNPGSMALPRNTIEPTFGLMEIEDDGKMNFAIMKYLGDGNVERLDEYLINQSF